MGGRPLRPPSRRCLGGPLPHQLADSPRAPLRTTALSRGRLFRQDHAAPPVHAVLARVSPGCPPYGDRSLTCYSPVRHSTHSRRSGLVRLACVRHAASVRPEPGSNSPIEFDDKLSFERLRSTFGICFFGPLTAEGNSALRGVRPNNLRPRLSNSVSADSTRIQRSLSSYETSVVGVKGSSPRPCVRKESNLQPWD